MADAGYCTQLIHDTPHLVNGGHAFDYPFHGWTFVRGAEVDRPRIDGEGFTYLPSWKRDPLFDFVGDPEMRDVRDHVLVTYTRANRHRQKPEDWNAAKLFLTATDFLREKGLKELTRRGADGELIEWLRGEGKGSFPESYRKRPGPEAWTQYWGHAYNMW